MNEEENTLLARWLSGNITDEEKKKLEESGDAETLRHIVSTVNDWSLPELAPNTYSELKKKLPASSAAKIIPLFKKPAFIAAAAGLLLIAGLFFILNPFEKAGNFTELACNAGETKQFSLMDHTTITLFGKSKITYNKETFESERKLTLEGEAFFEVNRKGDFEVDFKQGQVNVLGTKFIVSSSENEASVKCFEGKVMAKIENASAILTSGTGIKKAVDGKAGEFSFGANEYPSTGNYRVIENLPLEDVCNSLEIFYDVKIKNSNVDMSRKFSGVLHQTNLDSALMMVFTPMNIRYKRDNTTIVIGNN